VTVFELKRRSIAFCPLKTVHIQFLLFTVMHVLDIF